MNSIGLIEIIKYKLYNIREKQFFLYMYIYTRFYATKIIVVWLKYFIAYSLQSFLMEDQSKTHKIKKNRFKFYNIINI